MFLTGCVAHNQPHPYRTPGDRTGVYSQAPKAHTQHMYRASGQAQDQGSMRGVAVDLYTHSPAESTPSVCRSELTLIPSLPPLMERGWGSCQTIAESKGVPWHLPTSQAGCEFMGDLHMPASKAALLRPGLLPLSLQRPPKAPSGERVRTGATSGPPPHPSAQLWAWHKADVGE